MDPKSEEGIFLGYSINNMVFNTHTKTVMESINIIFDDNTKQKYVVEDVDDISPQQTYVPTDIPDKVFCIKTESENSEETSINKGPSIRIQKDHPIDNVIGNLNEWVITRSRNMIADSGLISRIEPKNVKEALTDEFWINSIQEELCKFRRNVVWELVHIPEDVNVIGTKWILKNKYE